MDVVNPTYICPICKRKRERLLPSEVICIHCKRTATKKAEAFTIKKVKGRKSNKGKILFRKVRKPNSKFAYTFHPADKEILTRMSRGSISIEKLYNLYFTAQNGQCKHCKAVTTPLRVKLNATKTSIKGLYCSKCLSKLKSPGSSRIPTLSQEMWRRADPLLRLMLSSNPTFVECAEKELIPCHPPKKAPSSQRASSNPSPSSQRLMQMELPYPPPSTISLHPTTPPSTTPKSQSSMRPLGCSKLPPPSLPLEIVPYSLKRWEQIILPLNTPPYSSLR